METGVASNRVVRCKTLSLDLSTRELFKDGQKLKLHGHPIDVLAMLLERPGELVTREQLRKKLWPETTYVDFEHGLNSTINRLRDALSDHADEPQFIETLPRLGYRFIVPLEDLLEEAQVSSLESPSVPDPPAESASPAAQETEPPNAEITGLRNHSNRRSWATVSSTTVIALAAAIWYLHRPLPPPYISESRRLTNDGQIKVLVGTDGSRLYFNREFPFSIAQVGIAGGDIAPIPVDLPNPLLIAVSPDGSALLVTSMTSGGLWSLQVPGGSLRLLSDAAIDCADRSPDGNSIVYSSHGDIFAMRSDGSEAHKLVAAQAFAPGSSTDSIVWSPDGKSIRLTAGGKLWEMSPDGTGIRPLLPGWRPSLTQGFGRWTSDGKFFLFRSQASAGINGQIWILDERRSLFRRRPVDPYQLTPDLIRWGRPIPSRDGKEVFARGTIDRGELVRYDVRSHQLQPFLGGISAAYVRFAPDGKFVAYVMSPEGVLWRANRDGSNPMQLTSSPLRAGTPQWSPDGTRILFEATDAQGQTKIYIVPSQGGAPQPFLPEQTRGLSGPYWSPDGRKVVFCSSGSGDPKSDLRILDFASHEVTSIPGSDGLFAPTWSPNGRFITGTGTGSIDLKVFDLETQRWSLLQKGGVGWPNWSRDGRFIYFVHWIHDQGVYRIRVSGGKVERVVDLTGFHTGLDGFMLLDPTDAPIMQRSTGTDEIYALSLEMK